MAEPIVTYRFPDPMLLKAGSSLECNFQIGMDFGNVRVEEAILMGSTESQFTAAHRLAHLLDSLNHFRERDLPPREDCHPKAHVDRAIRELSHALLALSEEHG